MAFSGGVNLRLIKCVVLESTTAAGLQTEVNDFTALLSNQTTERGDVFMDVQYLAPSTSVWVAIITYVGTT